MMTISEISAKAEEVAALYNPNEEAPFPYANVVRENHDLGVYFLVPNDETVSGATLYENEKFSILINSAKPQNRQNFTVGHELGHYFLHKSILKEETGLVDRENYLDGNKVLYRLDEGQRDTIEREANHFSACLLMPSKLVRKAWAVNDDVEKLAELFRVSTVAMSIRLTELGLVS